MIFRINKRNIINGFALLLLTLLLFSISFYQVFDNLFFRYFVVFVIIMFSLYVKIFKIKKINNINFRIVGPWFLFILVVLISCIYNNGSLMPVLEYCSVLILYFFLLQFIILDEAIIFKSLLLNGNLILGYSVLMNPLLISPYSGFYNNPNTFGLQLCASFIVCTFFLVKIKKNLVRFILAFNAFVFIYFIYLSKSRSSLIICFFSIIVIIFYIMKNNKVSKKKIIIFLLSSIFIFVVFILYFNEIYNFLYSLIYKYDTSSIDISSGRIDKQIEALNHINFFGNNRVSIHSFNDFLLTGQLYGYFAMLLHFINCLNFLDIAGKFYLKNKTYESLFYLVVIVSFFFLSFFEEVMGAFGIPLVVVMFISIGRIMNIESNKN